MTAIKAGNVPCSWDTLNIEGLGKGCVDCAAVTNRLRDRDHEGWFMVEQDVLPGMGTPKESAERNHAILRSMDL